jgi:hypothetical protein
MDKEFSVHVYRGDDDQSPPTSAVPAGFTIAELAREAGVTLRALRFYQSKGLLAAKRAGYARVFSEDISRKKCIEQINLLERQRREIERALDELRQIYTGMFNTPDLSRKTASR